MIEFAKLIDEKKINLLGIGDMGKEELHEVGDKLGLEKIKDKSLEMLRKEIGHLGKLFLAGQVCIFISTINMFITLFMCLQVYYTLFMSFTLIWSGGSYCKLRLIQNIII